MLIAVVAALLHKDVISYATIIAGMLLGAAIGIWLARRTAMTAMPELVASLNGVGGGASVAVAASTWLHASNAGALGNTGWSVAIIASIIIGAITLTGSAAVAKLKGSIGDSRMPKVWQLITLTSLITVLVMGSLFVAGGASNPVLLGVAIGFCLLLGGPGATDWRRGHACCSGAAQRLFGTAGAATGFVLDNQG